MSAKHTPTPWAISAEDPSTILGLKPGKDYTAVIAETKGYKEEREANAAHIVRCVNSHASLVEALEELTQLCEDEDRFPIHTERARAALALAKGE